MEVYERVVLLRKKVLKLTQEDFSSKLNISRSNLGGIEIGRINVTERNISDICRVYNVNENWLRTGEGEMFVELPKEDEYFKAATQIAKADDKLVMQALIEYWKLDDNGKKLLKDFIVHIVEKSKE